MVMVIMVFTSVLSSVILPENFNLMDGESTITPKVVTIINFVSTRDVN